MFVVEFTLLAGAGSVVAVIGGALALNPRWRTALLARYPIQVVSWLIATPFFLLSIFGILMLGGGESGPGGGISIYVVRFGAFAALAALSVVAVVICSRAARGNYARGPRLPAILGFGAPLVVATVMSVAVDPVDVRGTLLYLVLICAGAGVNGLLAARINSGRRLGLPAQNPNATFPPIVEQAPADVQLAPLPVEPPR